VSDLDLARFRRVLEESLRRFPDAEFLKDVRLLLNSYERNIEKRKLAERYPMRELVIQTLKAASKEAREGDVIEGDVMESRLQAAYDAGADAERARVFAMMRQDIRTATGLDWSPLEGRTLTWVFDQYKATAPTPNP